MSLADRIKRYEKTFSFQTMNRMPVMKGCCLKGGNMSWIKLWVVSRKIWRATKGQSYAKVKYYYEQSKRRYEQTADAKYLRSMSPFNGEVGRIESIRSIEIG